MRYIWKCVVVCWLSLLKLFTLQINQQNRNLSTSSVFIKELVGSLLLSLLFFSFVVQAEERQVAPGQGVLQKAIDLAKPGDTLLLSSGLYTGSINIHKTVSLLGTRQSVIDGEGSSHVITVSAPDVLIKGLTIQHSGNDYDFEDSAVFVTEKGHRAVIDSNYFENNLIGVYLKGPDAAVVSNNTIIGSTFHRMNDRGNGVYLWRTPGSVVKNNDIRYGRDGIFVNYSKNNLFEGNKFRDLRFAVHYMYTLDSEIKNNISLNNHVGFALMFSDRIVVTGNQSIGDHERGLFFNFTNYSVINNNSVSGGVKKCVFIYNANYNKINNNSFEDCQIGIHFTAGSEKNEIYSNAFINNRTQVKYVGTRYIEWSKNGTGNYWSDNPSFDIDGNGISDQPYQPNDLVDQIVWRHPMAKLLLNSPSVKILKWAQSEFPGIHPGGVTDSTPLMKPAETSLIMKRNLSDG